MSMYWDWWLKNWNIKIKLKNQCITEREIKSLSTWIGIV